MVWPITRAESYVCKTGKSMKAMGAPARSFGGKFKCFTPGHFAIGGFVTKPLARRTRGSYGFCMPDSRCAGV